MPLDISEFTRLAASTSISTRDLVVSGQGKTAKARLGNFIFAQSAEKNTVTMKAFRAALEKEYGAFGANAFDTVLGHRLEMRKSLRACDVRQTLSNLALIRQNRFVSEINRQLDTSPRMLELSAEAREAIHRELASNVLNGVELASLKSASDIAGAAQKRIEQAINKIRDQKDGLKTSDLGSRKNLETSVASNEPTGLKFQGDMFGKGETSVGDMIRHGLAGEGMRASTAPRRTRCCWRNSR